MMEPVRVLLVDDNPIFLKAAVRFLNEHDGIDVVGSAEGGHDALARAQELRPDLTLLDLAMPDLPGLQVIPLLRSALPGMKIIALTMLDETSYRQAALAAGADEFVSKATMNMDLLPAIRQVLDPAPGGAGGSAIKGA